MSERKGDWICTYTGIKFWPLDPRPEDVCIEDIAHSLSLQCRFAGHTRWFYSVGDHSLRVSDLCLDDPLWGLLHDAPEAYLVDLPRPIKRHSLLGAEYMKIERGIMAAIAMRFRLRGDIPKEVHEADDLILAWEKRDLVHSNSYKGHGDERFIKLLPSYKLEPRATEWVEQQFMEKFYELTRPTK